MGGSLHNWKPSEAHQEPAADRQNNTPGAGDTAQCCSVSEIGTYCYLTPTSTCSSNPKAYHWISQYKLAQPLFTSTIFNIISLGLLRSDAVSTTLHSITRRKAIT